MKPLALCVIVLATHFMCNSSTDRHEFSRKECPVDGEGSSFDAKWRPSAGSDVKYDAINASSDTPVTNIRIVVKNSVLSPMLRSGSGYLLRTGPACVVVKEYSKPMRFQLTSRLRLTLREFAFVVRLLVGASWPRTYFSSCPRCNPDSILFRSECRQQPSLSVSTVSSIHTVR